VDPTGPPLALTLSTDRRYCDAEVAADPSLFDPSLASRRTRANYGSSLSVSPLPGEREDTPFPVSPELWPTVTRQGALWYRGRAFDSETERDRPPETTAIAALQLSRVRRSLPRARRTPAPLPWLRVEGNRVRNPAGETIVLRGVTLSGLERGSEAAPASLAGLGVSAQDIAGIVEGWGANVVRVPINQRWALEQASYRRDLDRLVEWASARGAYTVLALAADGERRFGHREDGAPNLAPPLPDENSVRLWRQLGARYRHHSAVAYDLLARPHEPLDTDAAFRLGAPAGPDRWIELWHEWVRRLEDALHRVHRQALVFVGGWSWGLDLRAFPVRASRPLENVVYTSHVFHTDSEENATATVDDVEHWLGGSALRGRHPTYVGGWGGSSEHVAWGEQLERHLSDRTRFEDGRWQGLAGWTAWSWTDEPLLVKRPPEAALGGRSGHPPAATPFGQLVRRALSAAPPTVASTQAADDPPPALSLAERYAVLHLAESALERISERHGRDPATQRALASARAGLAARRAALTVQASEAQALVDIALVIERCERAAGLLGERRAAIEAEPGESGAGYLRELEHVRALYLDALAGAGEPDVVARLGRAEAAAAALPRALLEVDLTLYAERPATYHLLEPARAHRREWVAWVRRRLDAIQVAAAELAEARLGRSPELVAREGRLREEVELVQLSVEALGHWEAMFRAYDHLAGQHVMAVYTAWGSIGAINARCEAMRTAALAEDLTELRRRVTAHREDPDVAVFYRGLPLIAFGSRGLQNLAVVLVASAAATWAASAFALRVSVWARAGVAATAPPALTARTALAFAGTVTVEALTFTATSAALEWATTGRAPTARGTLEELAWSLGLFGVLRGFAAGLGRGLEGLGLELLRGPVSLVAAFPLLEGYGRLRYAVSRGHWPTDAEIDVMTAENVVMLAGVAVGLRAVQRWIVATPRPTQLQRFREAHGHGFEVLETARERLLEELGELVSSGRATDAVALADVRRRAAIVEKAQRELLDRATADQRFDLSAVRAELKALRRSAIEGSAELVERELALPADTALRRAGERSYSYRWGGTGVLARRLQELGARVARTQDPRSGARTVTATFAAGEAPVAFRERGDPVYGDREVSVDPADPTIQDYMARSAIADPAARRLLVWMVARRLSPDPSRTLGWALDQVKSDVRARLRANPALTPEALLRQLHQQGLLASGEDAALVARAEALARERLIAAEEWLDARAQANFRGALGEWLARPLVQARTSPGARVLRNVRFIGSLFADAAMTRPYERPGGGGSVRVEIVELDYLVAAESTGRFTTDAVFNVKASSGEGGRAATQNAVALTLLRAHASGTTAEIAGDAGPYYARVLRVEGTDAISGEVLDLSGRLGEVAGGASSQTIGPRGARGYDLSLDLRDGELTKLVALLRELQLRSSPDY